MVELGSEDNDDKSDRIMSSIDKNSLKKLWEAVDDLQGKFSSEQHMLFVFGILFLRYISYKYEKAVQQIKKNLLSDYWESFSKDKNILVKYDCSFFVPNEAKWTYISEYATCSSIGEKIDQAFLAIEEENSELRDLFDKNYNHSKLDPNKLKELVSVFANNINFAKYGENIVSDIYQYFLGNFFKIQGQKGGGFYTPKSIVKLLVALIKPHQGKIYDPACGTGGVFIEAQKYIQKNDSEFKSLSIYAQEKKEKIWKLAQINLLIHGFNIQDLNFGKFPADTFINDQHKGNLFDFVLVDPPFNVKKWGLEKLPNDDPRWQWGKPPKNNANCAWISHVLTKLNLNGKAGIVLDNGSLTRKNEKTIRKEFIKDNKIDAIISLPEQLFYTNGISACLWILNNAKKNQEVLMINASDLKGNMETKTLRKLTDCNINRITSLYQEHQSGKKLKELGFAKSVTVEEIEENNYSFSPGQYVGYSSPKIDKEKVKIEIKNLASKIEQSLDEFNKLVPKLKKTVKKALVFEIEEK